MVKDEFHFNTKRKSWISQARWERLSVKWALIVGTNTYIYSYSLFGLIFYSLAIFRIAFCFLFWTDKLSIKLLCVCAFHAKPIWPNSCLILYQTYSHTFTYAFMYLVQIVLYSVCVRQMRALLTNRHKNHISLVVASFNGDTLSLWDEPTENSVCEQVISRSWLAA